MFEASEDFDDDELQEDEEELLVYVEFPNCDENSMFGIERLKLDILGIDTETPIIQVNGKFFEGVYEDAVGTYMFFEKDNTISVDDPVFEVAPTLRYLTKSRKLLKMQRVFIAPRTEVLGNSVHNESLPNMETIVEAGVPPKYQDEALAFWTDARAERIDILNNYIEKQRIRREKRARGISPVSESDDDNPFMFTLPQNNGEEEEEPDEVLDGEDRLIEEEDEEENLSDCNPELNEFERFVENSAEQPSDYPEDEIDEPQPSTSREFKPFIGPGKTVIRNKGAVKVVKGKRKTIAKNQKPVDKKKQLRKETLEMDQSNQELMYENFPQTENVNDSEVEEFITDEIHTEHSRTIKREFTSAADKKLHKKEKREAKMKEISEQLRKMSGITQDEEAEEEEEMII